jgi:hypothetical protein
MPLLINLPPTDPAPLANYLPYLNLLRELLREHADQILPHPMSYFMSAIANQKFNQMYLQGYQPLQNHPEDCYEGPHQDAGV